MVDSEDAEVTRAKTVLPCQIEVGLLSSMLCWIRMFQLWSIKPPSHSVVNKKTVQVSDNFDPVCAWNGSYTPQTLVLQHQEQSYTRGEMHKIFEEICYYIAEVAKRPSLDS